MEVCINNIMKVVEFWLPQDVSITDDVMNDVKARYKVEKYTSVVYHSGAGKLLSDMKQLILYNHSIQAV